MPNNYPCWFACLNVKLNRDVILNSSYLCWFSPLNIKLAGGGDLYSQYRCWSSQLNVKCNASTRRDDGFIQRHGLSSPSSPSGPLGPSGPLSPWSGPVGARWGPLGPLGPSGPSGPLSPNLGKDYSHVTCWSQHTDPSAVHWRPCCWSNTATERLQTISRVFSLQPDVWPHMSDHVSKIGLSGPLGIPKSSGFIIFCSQFFQQIDIFDPMSTPNDLTIIYWIGGTQNKDEPGVYW